MKSATFLITTLVFVFLQPLSAFASDVLTCESRGGYHFCSAPIRYRSDVIFIEKISKASCNEGRTWGVRQGGIWVADGCRARFEIRGHSQYGYNRPGNYGNWWDHDHHYGSYPGSYSRPRPQSHDHHYNKPDHCPTGAWPGRCTDQQRRRGCQDFRTSSGLGCMTYK
ncbi:MAG: DUF3011 domain-containing protein [Bdellovibrionales bacterium]|nr:DUF3011 domain-containing protein [Bdellovibrionales bacterium]